MGQMSGLFQFHVSVGELMLRGSMVYWFLFFLFRFALRRDAGSVGLADILMVVLIADAAQNGMSGEYKSVSEAFVLIGTIAGWNYFIDWMSFRFGWFARFAQPRTVLLIRNGTLQRSNLKQQMVTETELESQLRTHGIEDLAEVKQASLEPDGSISVIRQSPSVDDDEGGRRRTPGAA